MEAILALEDGKVYRGKGFGAEGTVFGEVVFNTGMTGYQEVLTDPSYTGQIVTMTYPLIGNYGVNRKDEESTGPKVQGFVAREICSKPSNWRSKQTVDDYLKSYNVVGISGIDTRALTRRIRAKGTLRGAITTNNEFVAQPEKLISEIEQFSTNSPELVRSVTTSQVYHLKGTGPKVVVLDFGIKQNILRMLQAKGWDISVVPSNTKKEAILKLKPQGLFLSNGPGDPKDVPEAVETVKALMEKIPMTGICLGHQILGLALGCETYKLKFGHRGSNHPVKDILRDRTFITSQNHGYAISAKKLPAEVEVTHKNLNDNTVEGLRVKNKPIFSVQYHPEAAPGPEDSRYLFDEFTEVIRNII